MIGGAQVCGFETETEDHVGKFAFDLAIGGLLRRAFSILSWRNNAWTTAKQLNVPVRIKSDRKMFSVFRTVASGSLAIAENPFSDDFGAEFVAEFIAPGDIMVRRDNESWMTLSQVGRADAVRSFIWLPQLLPVSTTRS